MPPQKPPPMSNVGPMGGERKEGATKQGARPPWPHSMRRQPRHSPSGPTDGKQQPAALCQRCQRARQRMHDVDAQWGNPRPPHVTTGRRESPQCASQLPIGTK